MNPFVIDAEFLKSVVFFKNFTDDQLSYLRTCLRPVFCEPGQIILEQGEENDTLFIVFDGMAEVLIDGNHIAYIHKKGSLIGEMSLIHNTLTSATVKAVTKVELMSLRLEFLDTLPETKKLLIEKLIYNNYASLLSERLANTSRKAKLFEETTKKLEQVQKELKAHNETLEQKINERTQSLEESKSKLEKQNLQLQAGQMRLKESSRTKEMALQKIYELGKSSIPLFVGELEELAKEVPEDKSDRVIKMKTRVEEICEYLTPFTTLYENEKLFVDKKILLAEKVVKQHVISKMALGGTGLELDIVKKEEKLSSQIENNKYDLIFLAIDFLDKAEEIHQNQPNATIVLLAEKSLLDYLEQLHQKPYLKHIISKDSTDRNLTIKGVSTAVKKIFSNDFFGPEKLLTWGTEFFRHKITGSEVRSELIDKMNAHLKRIGVRSSHLAHIDLVAEEMLMNAVYDAPVDKEGNSLYNHVQRSEKVELEPQQQGRFKFGCDGMHVAISVSDPFGRLEKNTVLSYLSTLYRDNSIEMNAQTDKAGAGRGLYLIIRSSDLVIFNVSPGKRTEVISLFNIERNEEQQIPAFHFFETNS
ncbi:MAG: cyclic nucleotide-binding domain-containing protein [bacterium]